MMFNVNVVVDKRDIERDTQTMSEGFASILRWMDKHLPQFDVCYNKLTISYTPLSMEGDAGEITCASFATFLHEICHILEAYPVRAFQENYGLDDLNGLKWDGEMGGGKGWEDHELNKWDKNQAIRTELEVIYLNYDLLHRALPSWEHGEILEILYDQKEQFLPEYWAGPLEKAEGFDNAPAWMKRARDRIWDRHADLMADLVNAMGDAMRERLSRTFEV